MIISNLLPRPRVRSTKTVASWFFLLLTHCQIAQAPPTFAEALAAHGIGLSPTELDVALSSPDKRVRGLAAGELAELKAKLYLPKILHAAQIEPDLQTKINIASAATWLGSPEGLSMLKEICSNSNLAPHERQDAARHVFDKGDHACFRPVADMLLPGNDVDTRIGASYLLSQRPDLSLEESRLVLHRLLLALKNPEARLRLTICQTLRWLNDSGALPSLRIALPTEANALVRSNMKSAIDALESSKH